MACHQAGAQGLSDTNNGILLIGPLRANISEVLTSKLSIFIQENSFENVVLKMAAILSRPQWVKSSDVIGCEISYLLVMIYIVSMQKSFKTKHLLEFQENPYATHLYSVVFTKSGLMYAPMFVKASLEFRTGSCFVY